MCGNFIGEEGQSAGQILRHGIPTHTHTHTHTPDSHRTRIQAGLAVVDGWGTTHPTPGGSYQ